MAVSAAEVTTAGVSPDDRALIEQLYGAFNEKKPELLDKILAADWQDVPLAPGQGPGASGFKPLVAAFVQAFPDIQIAIHEMIGVPGRVAVRAEITGTHSGAWFGIAATGKAFSIPIHEFHHIRDGRITHTWHLEDWWGWFRQVGASFAP